MIKAATIEAARIEDGDALVRDRGVKTPNAAEFSSHRHSRIAGRKCALSPSRMSGDGELAHQTSSPTDRSLEE